MRGKKEGEQEDLENTFGGEGDKFIVFVYNRREKQRLRLLLYQSRQKLEQDKNHEGLLIIRVKFNALILQVCGGRTPIAIKMLDIISGLKFDVCLFGCSMHRMLL